MPQEVEQLLNVKKAAAFLGVHPATVRQWAKDKKIKAKKVGTRGDWRFTKKDLSLIVIPQERAHPKGASQRVIDIKHSQQAEQRLEVLISSINDHLVTYDRKWCFTFVNDAAAKVLGMPREKLLGKCIWKLFPDAVGNQYYRELHKAKRTNKPISSEHYYPPFNKWFLNYIYPFEDGVTVFATDITDRKHAEALLHDSESRYRQLVETAGIIPWESDLATGAFTYVGPQAVSLLGYPLKEWYKPTFWPDHIHKDDRDWVVNFCISSSKKKKEYEFEYRMIDSKGKSVWLRDIVTVVDGKDNKKMLRGFMLDITARKEAEEQLRKERERLTIALRTGKLGVYEWRVGEKTVWWSPETYTLYGVDPKSFKPTIKNFSKLIHPDEREELWRKTEESINNKTLFKHEYRIVTPKGTTRWVFNQSQVGINAKGQVERITGVVADITERKRIEEEILDQKQQLQILADSMPQLVWTANDAGEVDYYNAKKDEFDGIKLNKKNYSWAPIVHPDDLEQTWKAWKSAVENKSIYQMEHRIKIKDGTYKWFLSRAIPIKKNGKIIRWYGTATDIHDNKMMEQLKDEFMGIASHELKTPVTSVKVYTQVLHKLFTKKGDTKSAEMLMKMEVQLNKLTSLIADLLDVTKIQGGKLQFNESKFDLNELIQEIVEEIQRTTIKHALIIKTEKTKSIYGDRDRIGQVLINLLTNAIKYSPDASKIIVKSKMDKDSVTVSVKDFGLGISKDKQVKIFERFYRVLGDKKETIPGIGLGLYISSEIIKRQGGKIWVESIEGKGSTFYFNLPINKSGKN